MVARDGETHRDRGTMYPGEDAAVEGINRDRICKFNEGNALITGPDLVHKASFGP